MRMFRPQRRYHLVCDQLSDCISLDRDSCHLGIFTNYQPFYNTSHTMKPSDPMLLADVTLRCRMYPAGKVDISQHLAIPGFPQSDHTVGKPSADAGSLCSIAYFLASSHPQMSASHLLGLQVRANRPS